MDINMKLDVTEEISILLVNIIENPISSMIDMETDDDVWEHVCNRLDNIIGESTWDSTDTFIDIFLSEL